MSVQKSHFTSLSIKLFSLGLLVLGLLWPTSESQAHVRLVAPNGGEQLSVGSTVTIEWTVLIAHSLIDWDLEYSVSGAAGPWLTIADNLPPGDPSTGSLHTYEWTVPEAVTNQARVRVHMDNTGTDYVDGSDADLSITAAATLTSIEVASNLSYPIYMTAPDSDSSRLFIVEQTGAIRIVKNDVLLAQPFLDLSTQIISGGEQGLLSLAFHPDYANNGFFYVYYTADLPLGQSTVARFSVSANPDSADDASEQMILTQAQPFDNHNGGQIAFGPNDGYLYIGFGDGGSEEDPLNNGQSDTTWLGKMLRIDVDGASPYAIPVSNPYAGSGTILNEIWAHGLRNPWRFSFDRLTGDLWIADVGQNLWEEIDFQDESSSGGENYGWRLKEATKCFNPASGCDPGGLLDDPIFEYQHMVAPLGFRCAITGGFVYRGCAMPDLQGTYFYADYCTGEVWSFSYDGVSLIDFADRTSDLFGGSPFQISSFGQDAWGELYILQHAESGKLHKIVPVGDPSQCVVTTGCCGLWTEGFTGNVECDTAGKRNLTDITRLIDRVYVSKLVLCCEENGNVDGDPETKLNLSDITLLIDHVYVSKGETAVCE